jgi:hypothetical protein
LGFNKSSLSEVRDQMVALFPLISSFFDCMLALWVLKDQWVCNYVLLKYYQFPNVAAGLKLDDWLERMELVEVNLTLATLFREVVIT